METSTNGLVGRSIRFQFDHLRERITCRCEVISVTDGIVRARLPRSVMAMPFPPFGKRNNIVLVREDVARRFLVD
jgi:hypothetical protein